MTPAERFYTTPKELPEPAGNELLVELAGGLENSKTFSGDSLQIQKRLRDEWEESSKRIIFVYY